MTYDVSSTKYFATLNNNTSGVEKCKQKTLYYFPHYKRLRQSNMVTNKNRTILDFIQYSSVTLSIIKYIVTNEVYFRSGIATLTLFGFTSRSNRFVSTSSSYFMTKPIFPN